MHTVVSSSILRRGGGVHPIHALVPCVHTLRHAHVTRARARALSLSLSAHPPLPWPLLLLLLLLRVRAQVVLRSLTRLRIELSPSENHASPGDYEDVRIDVKLMHARSNTTLTIGPDSTVEQLSLAHFNVAAMQTLVASLPLRQV